MILRAWLAAGLIAAAGGIAWAAEPAAPALDPRLAGPALEVMQATIRLRDVQLTVMAERVAKLEAELQAKTAAVEPAK